MVASLETRFAHTHILGGSGHGKTQLLQTLIHRDLTAKTDFPSSIVVIDSQGDLINTISHLALFDPDVEGSLAEQLLLIDPTDIDYPPAINLFDANLDRIKAYGRIEQERIFNGTIELYEYFFSALLGAGLSQKQNLIFRYPAQLMLTIPGANIHTLRELLEEPDAFQKDIAKLDGTARLFFERQFFDKSYDDTRTQVSRRLWGILANRSFERIFSSRTSRIDLFEAMNDGKIILINTAKDLLKQEGAAIFGRFFIAMIAQAALERVQIPRDERRPTFVYIDEAQDYFDEHIDHMLEQVRKYKIGLTLAHQTLAQLDTKLKASIMANTGTKLVGGASASDAATMAKEMGCSPEFLQSMRKTKTTTSFAVWIKNETPRPREVTVKLGAIDGLPTMSDGSYRQLIKNNQEKYGLPIGEVYQPNVKEETVTTAEGQAEPVQTTTESNPSPVTMVEVTSAEPQVPDHRTMQAVIRERAQQLGFYVSIEKQLRDGKRIDVVFEREDMAVACEISCTTKPAHEIDNLKKCLGADFNHIWSVATTADQVGTIRSLAEVELTPENFNRITFVDFDGLDAAFAVLPKLKPASVQNTVLGYDVEVKRVPISDVVRTQKQKRLQDVLALEIAN